MGMPSPSIVVVTRETRMRGLMKKFATRGQVSFQLAMNRKRALADRVEMYKDRGIDLSIEEVEDDADQAADYLAYEAEDNQYRSSIDSLKRELELGYPVKFIDRAHLPTYEFWECPVVVVVGPDGLVANTAKYVGDTPIVAVNPDPKNIDGVLLPFHVRQVREAAMRTIKGRAKVREVTLAEVNLTDGQKLLAFNDFFIGCSSHVSARYTLRLGEKSETHSSSGMLVSTGAGSTGWLSSLFNMFAGFANWAGGKPVEPVRLAWEDRRLVWAVREPFRSKSSGADLVAGFVEENDELVVESLMPTNGVIFSDGVESDFLEFASGTIAKITTSKQRAKLVTG